MPRRKIFDESEGGFQEHRLALQNDARGYIPYAGENDGEGQHGSLAANSVNAGSFKSARFYPSDKGWVWTREEIDAAYPSGYVPNVRVVEPEWRRAELEAQMPTYRPIAPVHIGHPG